MFSHTIAIARCLLLDGRANEVEDMIIPIIRDASKSQAAQVEPGNITLLRCLLAQAYLLGDQQTEHALRTLEPVMQDTTVSSPQLAHALSQLWAGWAHILAGETQRNIPYAIYLIRSAYRQLDTLHRGDYMYWAQIGHVLALSRLGQRAQMEDLLNEIITCTSFARDALAKKWMQMLIEDQIAPWNSKSDNVMHASYSKGSFLRACKLVSEGNAPVLFTGERGVGKESTGRLIHEMQGHSPEAFMCIDCEAISSSQYPEPLPLDVASGLPAHTKTIFLNHVEQLPAQLQQSVLSTLNPLYGAPREPHEDSFTPRIFAATTDDLVRRVNDGVFNRALYNVLQINTLHVSPLRSRLSDIPLLALHFAHHFRPVGVPFVAITEEALVAMLEYTWPGNVRQLRNEMERAITLVTSEPIPVVDERALPEQLKTRKQIDPIGTPDTIPVNIHYPLEKVLASTEKQIIEQVLASNHGQVAAAASHLGLTRQGLYKKIKRLGIVTAQFQDDTKKESHELLN